MSAADNLLANLDKTAFTSYLNADKIAVYSLANDSSGSGIGSGARITAVAPSNPTSPQTTIASVANPYGKRALITLSWSLDNANFYPMNVPVFYYNPAYNSYFWQALAYGGCSDSTIYFGAVSQYTTDQTVYFQFSLDSPI